MEDHRIRSSNIYIMSNPKVQTEIRRKVHKSWRQRVRTMCDGNDFFFQLKGQRQAIDFFLIRQRPL